MNMVFFRWDKHRRLGPDGRFFEDSTGKNYTFFIDERYDASTIRQALNSITDGNSSLFFNNCQDWADRYEKNMTDCQKRKSLVHRRCEIIRGYEKF